MLLDEQARIKRMAGGVFLLVLAIISLTIGCFDFLSNGIIGQHFEGSQHLTPHGLEGGEWVSGTPFERYAPGVTGIVFGVTFLALGVYTIRKNRRRTPN
jgi:hypothetical protein